MNLKKTTPALPVVNINEAVQFYEGQFNFKYRHKDDSFAIVGRVEVEGIDTLYEEYSQTGVLYNPETVVEQTAWETREFPALDLHRKLITFYECL